VGISSEAGALEWSWETGRWDDSRTMTAITITTTDRHLLKILFVDFKDVWEWRSDRWR
jgi:hypothetical protein